MLPYVTMFDYQRVPPWSIAHTFALFFSIVMGSSVFFWLEVTRWMRVRQRPWPFRWGHWPMNIIQLEGKKWKKHIRLSLGHFECSRNCVNESTESMAGILNHRWQMMGCSLSVWANGTTHRSVSGGFYDCIPRRSRWTNVRSWSQEVPSADEGAGWDMRNRCWLNQKAELTWTEMNGRNPLWYLYLRLGLFEC